MVGLCGNGFAMIKFHLPLGPSVNHYLGRYGSRSFLTKQAKEYIAAVKQRIEPFYRQYGSISYPVKVLVHVWVPDARRRDVMNYEKVCNDALTRARLWVDDSLIHDYHIIRMGMDRENPRMEIEVRGMHE